MITHDSLLIKTYSMQKILKIFHTYIPHILIGATALLISDNLWAAGCVTGICNSSGSIVSIFTDSMSGDFFTSVRNIALSLLDAARIALNWVALLAILYVGYLWATSMGSEEKQDDGKMRLVLVIMGLFLINVPKVIYTILTGSNYLDSDFRKVQSISTGDPGGELSESALDTCNYFFCPQNFWGNGSTVAVIKFFEILMLVTAVVMFSWGGLTLIFRGHDEAYTKTAKMRLIYGMIALIVVGFLDTIYRAVFFWEGLDASGIISVIVAAANFFLFLAGPVAIIYLIVGAYYFITSAGDEERADQGKRILLYTFLATILLLLSYTFLVEIVGLNLI